MQIKSSSKMAENMQGYDKKSSYFLGFRKSFSPLKVVEPPRCYTDGVYDHNY
jgi:hypothetical protein